MNDSMPLSLGEKILILRRRKGFSRKQLADIIGVTVSTIANYENGVTIPDMDKVTKLSEMFGVSLDMLLLRPEAEKNNSHIHKPKSTQNQLRNMF